MRLTRSSGRELVRPVFGGRTVPSPSPSKVSREMAVSYVSAAWPVRCCFPDLDGDRTHSIPAVPCRPCSEWDMIPSRAAHLENDTHARSRQCANAHPNGRDARLRGSSFCFPSRRQLTFMSPMTLIAVRQRSRNQSTVSRTGMNCTGRPTAVKTMVIVTRPASGIPAAPTEQYAQDDHELLVHAQVHPDHLRNKQGRHGLVESSAVVVKIRSDQCAHAGGWSRNPRDLSAPHRSPASWLLSSPSKAMTSASRPPNSSHGRTQDPSGCGRDNGWPGS